MKDEYIRALSALTNLPEVVLQQIFRLNMLEISHELKEQEDNSIKKVNLGTYGELVISVSNNSLAYKFLPSEEFNGIVRSTILTKKDLLVDTAESRLIQKIHNNYDDVLDGTLEDINTSTMLKSIYDEVANILNNKVTKTELLSRLDSILVSKGMRRK